MHRFLAILYLRLLSQHKTLKCHRLAFSSAFLLASVFVLYTSGSLWLSLSFLTSVRLQCNIVSSFKPATTHRREVHRLADPYLLGFGSRCL